VTIIRAHVPTALHHLLWPSAQRACLLLPASSLAGTSFVPMLPLRITLGLLVG
jgi:hypothetical protein